MKTIRIDTDLYEHLGKLATNFETPNQVIRKIAGLEPKTASKRGPQRQRVERTPQSAFRLEILQIIAKSGGSLRAKEVLKNVGQKMASKLTKIDHERLNTGQIRWKNTVQWTRQQLVHEGLLLSTSPRGIWEITEAGQKALKNRDK